MKVACVWIPHFAFYAQARRQPELRNGPVILATTQGARKMVADFSPHLSGVYIGMPLQAALATAGKARVVEADEAHQRREFQEVLHSLQQRCPSVQPDLLGCVYLNVTGMEEPYGDDANLALVLQRTLPQGYPSQMGIGPNKFVAYLAARVSETGRAFKAPDDARKFVQQFPMECLPTSTGIVAKLRQYGCNTLGEVAALGIGPLQTQFGPEGRHIWELANGMDTRPLVPMREKLTVSSSMYLPYADVSLDLLLISLEVLLRKLFAKREVRGKYAGRADLECSATGTLPWRREYAFKERLGSPSLVLLAINSRLLPDPPRFYVEEVSLALSDFAGESGAQGRLLQDTNQRGDGAVEELAQRLQSRSQGKPALYRVVRVHPDHPLPERRSVLVPVNPEAADDVRPVHQPVLVLVRRQGQELTVVHPHMGGPERATIQEAWKVDLWWLSTPAHRTYYRAITTQGKPITLFQDNLSGHWYVQQP